MSKLLKKLRKFFPVWADAEKNVISDTKTNEIQDMFGILTNPNSENMT